MDRRADLVGGWEAMVIGSRLDLYDWLLLCFLLFLLSLFVIPVIASLALISIFARLELLLEAAQDMVCWRQGFIDICKQHLPCNPTNSVCTVTACEEVPFAPIVRGVKLQGI